MDRIKFEPIILILFVLKCCWLSVYYVW